MAGIEFVDHPSFHEPNALQAILDAPLPEARRRTRVALPRDLPGYLQHLYRVALLSPAEEASLFRRMNFLKFDAARTRLAAKQRHGEESLQRQAAERLAHAERLRQQIIESNLRLVVALAKQMARPSTGDFELLVSEGNAALVRAVDGFNFGFGFKFSTYAHQAIRRAMIARLQQDTRRRQREAGAGDASVADLIRDDGQVKAELARAAEAGRVAHALLACLSPRERVIVAARFGLGDDDTPRTFHSIGEELGVSKERVRQLQSRALQKMRVAANEQGWEDPWD